MKGFPGVMIAAGLGLLGAILNWFYISQQAADYEKVAFVAVKSGASMKVGDKFSESQLMKVEIPRAHLSNLDKIAIPWSERYAVIGDTAKKVYVGDELIFQSDLRSTGVKRPIELLRDNEVAISVAVNTGSFVSSRVNPGDFISFAVPKLTVAAPRAVSSGQSSSSDTELVGPFRILMVGNRTGSPNAFKASGGSARQENVITVSVKYENGQFEAKAKRLFEIKQLFGSEQVQVVLLPEGKEELDTANSK